MFLKLGLAFVFFTEIEKRNHLHLWIPEPSCDADMKQEPLTTKLQVALWPCDAKGIPPGNLASILLKWNINEQRAHWHPA